MIWRLLQRIRAVRLLAAVLVGCFLLAACNTLLPHGFEFTFENGNQCAKGGDCASGFCSVDSLCCAEVCSGPCQSCKGGETCSSVPKDSKGACTGDEVCSAEGLCYCSNQGFLGSPTGRIVYFAGVGPSSVAALDLNGDGKPDLAVANGIDNTLSVLLSKGDGTFRLPSSVFRLPSSVFRAPLSCACACALWIRIPKRARARARGPRTKTEGRKTKDERRRTADDEYRTNQERAPPYDGDPTGKVGVLLNQGNGTFAAANNYPAGKHPKTVVAADLNSDGKPDLATANAAGDDVTVLFNHGDGTFGAPVSYPVGTTPWGVAAADLNGDGILDLAVANYSSDDVTVLLNTCLP